MRLQLDLYPATIVFVERDAPGAYPWLVAVGGLALSARAGHLSGIGVGETPSVRVRLDNVGRQAAALLGRPLRARATVYDDAGDAFFAGAVAGVEYGRTIDLMLEA